MLHEAKLFCDYSNELFVTIKVVNCSADDHLIKHNKSFPNHHSFCKKKSNKNICLKNNYKWKFTIELKLVFPQNSIISSTHTLTQEKIVWTIFISFNKTMTVSNVASFWRCNLYDKFHFFEKLLTSEHRTVNFYVVE